MGMEMVISSGRKYKQGGCKRNLGGSDTGYWGNMCQALVEKTALRSLM